MAIAHVDGRRQTRPGRGDDSIASSPAISVVIPCRNERNYIEACIRSILAQNSPPGGLEIIVADGMSDDGTRDILERLAQENPHLQIIDNPSQVTPCARNIGVRMARGQYIAILDAHTEYSPDYLRICAALLDEHPEVCCSGGPIISRGKGVFGRAAALAMSHPLGIGNAKHRFPSYEGYAEGACFPMFRREVFDKIGLFDETLVRNQDDEFNYRIARAGERVFISPRARCTYYVREIPSKLFWQYYQYGYWRVAVLRKHRLPTSLRQLAPVAFFSSMIMLFASGFCLPGWWGLTSVILPLVYVLILATAGSALAISHGFLVGLMFPTAATLMHLGYAVGFVWGVMAGGRQSISAASLTR